MRHNVAHFFIFIYFCSENGNYVQFKPINMKKFTLVIMALLALAFNVKAQQFVSTEPANRNVILEEFTGRNCQYCPDGHRIANEIMASHPGRAWAINVHAGGYATTTYPNFITPDGNTIHGGFSISGYPSGVVNRSTAAGQSRSAWANLSNTQLNQPSECNIAGRVQINPDTRMASITVEVYYTGNSSADENYLTVAMLQDSILGSQSGGSTWNPNQMINGQYVHMHILRDVITESAWGEAISPTTQGTLITKTYEYQIPEVIGSPNGVDVILDHIFFLAWVSERYQGTATRPILTGCELEKTTMTDEPIYPIVTNVEQAVSASCSQKQSFSFEVSNIGTDELTSLKFNAEVGNATKEFEWNGNLPSGDKTMMDFDMDMPFGTFTGHLNIVEANGVSFEYQSSLPAVCEEWIDFELSEPTTTLKVYVIQDQWGEQITWDIINSAGDIIGQGGPYQHLAGSGSTQPNITSINDVPANDCYLFRIYDNNGNGICCNYGNGYYQVKDGHGNVIFGGEGNGDFGEMASQQFSLRTNTSVVTEDPRVLGYNNALFIGTIDGAADAVGFEYYKLTDHIVHEVEGELDGSVFTANVDVLEAGLMYSVKAYALVGNNKVYGAEKHFHTWYEGVSELENSLKVYPNPASQVLNVEGSMTSVEVYNTVGQCLLSKQVNGNTQIDLSGFNNGFYFLRVYNGGETVVRKFSVNR